MNRAYRFGFLASDGSAAAPQGWREASVGGLFFAFHPETPFEVFQDGDACGVLVGHVFSLGPRTPKELVTSVLRNPDDLSPVDYLSGRWALFVLCESTQFVLHDAFGGRATYYSCSGPLAIASHIALLGEALSLGRSERTTAFMKTPDYRARTVQYLPGDLTVFDEVRGLVPNNLYDMRARSTRRYWPRGPLTSATFDEFEAELSSYFANFSRYLSQRMPVFLGVTAGIDTRAAIALLLANGLAMETLTWRQAVPDQDWPVIHEMARLAAVPHRIIEVAQPDSPVAVEAGRNGGPHRGANRIAAALATAAPDGAGVFVIGHGGEVMRGFYNLRHPDKPLQCDAARMFFHYNSSLKQTPGSDYTAFCLEAFEAFIDRAHYADIKDLGFDWRQLFYWEHRMGMWSGPYHNESDTAINTLPAYNSRRLYEKAFGMPSKERVTKTLLQRVVARYNPEMANLPML